MKYFLFLLVPCCAALACGPSFQALYECDVRFEHCYAVDQTTATPDVKRTCWRDWLHGYTYGQSRDRVEYAATRFGQLSLDTTPGLVVGNRTVAAPMPTNAFSPPPNLADGRDGGETPPEATSSPVQSEAPSVKRVAHATAGAPGSECAEGCAQLWSTCHGHCRDKGCELCNDQYRACVPACFGGESSASRPSPRGDR